jgi:adhesin transport system membrane fusion protein
MKQPDDLDFANDIRAAVERQSSGRGASGLILLVMLVLVVAGLWANYAIVDETTSAQGKVIPSSQVQVVQTLEGGIVREILIREGDLVEQDKVLMRIDDTGAASRLGELKQKRFALLAETARLEAEVNDQPEMTVEESLEKEVPEIVAAERAAFAARHTKRNDEREVLSQQLSQREQELSELDARQAKAEALLAPLARELELTRALHKKGVIPEVELLRLTRQHAELEGELNVIKTSLPRAKSAIEESRSRLAGAAATAKAEARERLAKARGELAVAVESEKAAADKVVRAALKAPVRGVVNKINITTVGAVVQPGYGIVEIIPLDDTLLVEARIRPKDVAFISPAQQANVKFTAYDYLTYGFLVGSIERISADTFVDEDNQAYYRATIRTEKNHIDHEGRKLPIIPGMIASVDILTGRRSVLDYLLKPINRARYEVFHER